MNDINIELAEILEVELISDAEVLDDFDLWDSLAFLSLAAFVDTTYNIQVDSDEFEDVKTVSDIKELVRLKK